MSENTDTGKELKGVSKPKKKTESDPFDRKRQKILAAIEAYKGNILEAHKKIELVDSFQSIVKLFSGAKVVTSKVDLRHYNPIKVSLPDIETLGAFFRELEHLKSKWPNVKLTYSGEVDGDEVLANVRIEVKSG